MNETIHDLLHLLSIAFAVGLAYIALDRFRYSRVVLDLLKDTREAILQIVLTKTGSQRDITLSRIDRHIRDIHKEGLGWKILYFWGPKIFSSKRNRGCDGIIISCFLFVEFVFIVIASRYPHVGNSTLYNTIFIFSILGIVLPVIFVFSGKNQVDKYQKIASNIILDLGDAYKLQIDTMEGILDNLLRS